MPAHLLGLGTAVPTYKIEQPTVCTAMASAMQMNAEQSLWYSDVASSSAIASRYSVVPEFSRELPEGRFLDSLLPQQPGLKKRHEVFKREAPKLAEDAARKALEDWGGSPEQITHLIAVSCTGLMAPGIDVLLTDALALPPTVERFGMHFNGCFGAFKGLAAAQSLVAEDSRAKVLAVCVELCTLHFLCTEDKDTLVANLLFADGAGAAVVGTDEKAEWRFVRRESALIPNSRESMSWDVGDHAFVMHMSRKVPVQIGRHIRPLVHNLIQDEVLVSDCAFAIHPGGKAILESVERACDLAPSQSEDSWGVLNEMGNMSSPTILFILDRLRRASQDHIVALGFGPGLTAEGMYLRRGS